MPYPTQESITSQARELRLAENEALLKTLEIPPPSPPRKKTGSLESLLKAFDKAEKLREETEALKPSLEREIAAAMDTGDALNETVAHAIQIKRTQLELVPVKLEQIRLRLEDLTTEIQAEFTERFIVYERQFAHVLGVIHKHLDGLIRPLMADDFMVEHLIANLVPHSKLNRRYVGELAYIQQQKSLGNVIAAARELLKREPAAAAILAEADKLAAATAKK